MTDRRKFGRRKGDCITRFIAQIIVAVSVIAGCQAEYVDTIPLPNPLPKASFSESPSEEDNGLVFKNMPTLKVEWLRLPGVVDIAHGGYTDEQLAAAGDEFFDTWKAFEEAVEPRPYYVQAGVKKYDAWTTDLSGQWKIKNDTLDPWVIIERFYLADLKNRGSYAEREAAYFTFQKSVMDIITEIEETLEERERGFYADAIEAMEAYIQQDPPGGDLKELTVSSEGKSIFSDKGRLVDYFFGKIPELADFYPSNNLGN